MSDKRVKVAVNDPGVIGKRVAVENGEIYLTYPVHNEAISIPENIDAIRALTAVERDGARSI
jgi:glyceraldehyde-3-phosphate dehydrogenase/erythrose-4-phosphate dehydrogenase